jgi:Dyp-type peroxidase family
MADTTEFKLNNTEPIDEQSPTLQQVLDKLQGNILKGHGRDYGVYIFFSFGNELAAVKAQLAELVGRYVTSALRQHRDAADYRAFKIPGGLFGNMLLSASGYRKLGRNADEMFPEEPDTIGGATSSFAVGLKPTAVSDFGDPPIDQWESGYQKPIDAMLLLADDDKNYLLREARRVITIIEQHNTVAIVEIGEALRNQDREGIEHFGYVDGRSQPLYLKSDFDFDNAGKRIGEKNGGNITVWDPFEPLRRVLVRDPGIANDSECHGSFFVFRKLEQDVLHFKMREEDLADSLGFEGEERERAGAMVVGRFEDGTPVTLSKTDGFRPQKENNFTYAADTTGAKCPFHAHIRKANPRGDIPRTFDGTTEEDERKRRITRRGITFGSRIAHPNTFQALDDLPSKGVGLLFMCFQASIRQQFAFMQRSWCNAPDFVKEGTTGIDPVIGQSGGQVTVEQSWSKEYNGPADTKFRFQEFVHMKGGEYFFAPSIPFFRSL